VGQGLQVDGDDVGSEQCAWRKYDVDGLVGFHGEAVGTQDVADHA